MGFISSIQTYYRRIKIGNLLQKQLTPGCRQYNPQNACQIFKQESGKSLHVASDDNLISFSLAPRKILKYIRKNCFPKDINHVILGHGEGNVFENNWRIIGTQEPVFNYLSRVIPEHEKALVLCCENTPKKMHHLISKTKRGIGGYVNTELTSLKHPAKIVKDGEIIGHYAKGKCIYYDA